MSCFKRLQRLLSGVIIVTFFVTNTLTPVPTAYAKGVEHSANFFAENAFKIPAEFGKVTETIQSSSEAPLLIHIEEAHANYDAQTNIKYILEHLAQNYGLNLILLEGAGDKLQPELFSFFSKDKKLNATVTDNLLKAGELTGAEAFLIDQDVGDGMKDGVKQKIKTASDIRHPASSVEGWGVENAGAYAENRAAYKKVYQNRKIAENFLNAFYLRWQKSADEGLNKSLRGFLDSDLAYEEERLPLQGWLAFLKQKALGHLKIDLEDVQEQRDWPVLVRYFRLQKIGSQIDEAKTLKEQEAFLADLKTRKVPESLLEEITKLLEYKATSDLPLYKTRFAFEKLMDYLPKDYSFEPYPVFRLHLQQLILLSELQGERLQGEMRTLAQKMTVTLTKTEAEKKLTNILHQYRLLKKLFKLELRRSEYLEIRSQKITPGTLLTRLGLKPAKLSAVTRLFETAADFYQGAIVREEHMMQNAMKVLAAQRSKKAVLITGGFHTGGLKERITASGNSYIGITPAIGEITPDNNKNYLTALLGSDVLSKSQIAPEVISQPSFFKAVSPRLWRRELATRLVRVRGIVRQTVASFGGRVAENKNEFENTFQRLIASIVGVPEKVQPVKITISSAATSLSRKTPEVQIHSAKKTFTRTWPSLSDLMQYHPALIATNVLARHTQKRSEVRESYEAKRAALEQMAQGRAFVPLLGFAAVKLYNAEHKKQITIEEAATIPDTQAAILAWAIKKYGAKTIPAMMDLSAEHEAVILANLSPEKRAEWIAAGKIHTVNGKETLIDLHGLKASPQLHMPLSVAGIDWRSLKDVDPATTGRLNVSVETLKKMDEKVGHKVPKIAYSIAPYTLAAFLMGDNEAMLAMMDREDGIRDDEGVKMFEALFHYSERLIAANVERMIKEGGADMVVFLDPRPTGMVSPEQFLKYSVDPVNRLSRKVRQLGALSVAHPCRPQSPEDAEKKLPFMIRYDVDVLSVDSIYLLPEVYDAVEEANLYERKPVILGNMDTLSILPNEDPKVVRHDAQWIFRIMGKRPFIFCSSCDIDTTPENMHAFAGAAAHEAKRFRSELRSYRPLMLAGMVALASLWTAVTAKAQTVFPGKPKLETYHAEVGASTSVTQFNSARFRWDYSIQTKGSWLSAVINFVAGGGTQDISGNDQYQFLARGYNSGTTGNQAVFSIEFKDADGDIARVYREHGIYSSEFALVTVAKNDLLNYNPQLSLDRIKEICFVIESNYGMPEYFNGWLEVKTGGLYFTTNINPNAALTPSDTTPLPDGTAGAPRPTTVNPAGATVTTTSTSHGIQITYNNGAETWSGGGLTWDDYGTPGIETGDLSDLSNFIFSIHGNPSQVKMEVVDYSGGTEHKEAVYLTQVSSGSQEWSVSADLFAGVDLSHTRTIYFIVEGAGANGSLYVDHRPATPDLTEVASVTNGNTVTFKSFAGSSYKIQYKNSMQETSWQDAETVIAAGAETTWTDDGSKTGGLSRARFYRVVYTRSEMREVIAWEVNARKIGVAIDGKNLFAENRGQLIARLGALGIVAEPRGEREIIVNGETLRWNDAVLLENALKTFLASRSEVREAQKFPELPNKAALDAFLKTQGKRFGDREIFILYHRLDLTDVKPWPYKKIARELDFSVGTIEKAEDKLLMKLRYLLARDSKLKNPKNASLQDIFDEIQYAQGDAFSATRLGNIFLENNIEDLDALCQKTVPALLKYWHMGMGTVHALETALDAYGLKLGAKLSAQLPENLSLEKTGMTPRSATPSGEGEADFEEVFRRSIAGQIQIWESLDKIRDWPAAFDFLLGILPLDMVWQILKMRQEAFESSHPARARLAALETSLKEKIARSETRSANQFSAPGSLASAFENLGTLVWTLLDQKQRFFRIALLGGARPLYFAAPKNIREWNAMKFGIHAAMVELGSRTDFTTMLAAGLAGVEIKILAEQRRSELRQEEDSEARGEETALAIRTKIDNRILSEQEGIFRDYLETMDPQAVVEWQETGDESAFEENTGLFELPPPSQINRGYNYPAFAHDYIGDDGRALGARSETRKAAEVSDEWDEGDSNWQDPQEQKLRDSRVAVQELLTEVAARLNYRTKLYKQAQDLARQASRHEPPTEQDLKDLTKEVRKAPENWLAVPARSNIKPADLQKRMLAQLSLAAKRAEEWRQTLAAAERSRKSSGAEPYKSWWERLPSRYRSEARENENAEMDAWKHHLNGFGDRGVEGVFTAGPAGMVYLPNRHDPVAETTLKSLSPEVPADAALSGFNGVVPNAKLLAHGLLSRHIRRSEIRGDMPDIRDVGTWTEVFATIRWISEQEDIGKYIGLIRQLSLRLRERKKAMTLNRTRDYDQYPEDIAENAFTAAAQLLNRSKKEYRRPIKELVVALPYFFGESTTNLHYTLWSFAADLEERLLGTKFARELRHIVHGASFSYDTLFLVRAYLYYLETGDSGALGGHFMIVEDGDKSLRQEIEKMAPADRENNEIYQALKKMEKALMVLFEGTSREDVFKEWLQENFVKSTPALAQGLQEILDVPTGEPLLRIQKIIAARELILELEDRTDSSTYLYNLYHLDRSLGQLMSLSLADFFDRWDRDGDRSALEALGLMRRLTTELLNSGFITRYTAQWVELLGDRTLTFDQLKDVLIVVEREIRRELANWGADYYEAATVLYGDDYERSDNIIALIRKEKFATMAAFKLLEKLKEKVEQKKGRDARAYLNPEAAQRLIQRKEDDPFGDILHIDDFKTPNYVSHAYEKKTYGGKGSYLMRMNALGLPVPSAFVIPSYVGKYSWQKTHRDAFRSALRKHLEKLEKDWSSKSGKSVRYGRTPEEMFKEKFEPLFLSVRSGAVFVMPGIFETAICVGFSPDVLEYLINHRGLRAAYSAYLGFMESMGVSLGIARGEFEEITHTFMKEKQKNRWEELSGPDLVALAGLMKQLFEREGVADQYEALFLSPEKQLELFIDKVFESWNSPKARRYRREKNISDEWYTPVVVQAYVFGDREASGAGIALSRDRQTNEKVFSGEWIPYGHGMMLMQGRLEPGRLDTLRKKDPASYKILGDGTRTLEEYFGVPQMIEFTIEEGKPWILQTVYDQRVGHEETFPEVDWQKVEHPKELGEGSVAFGDAGALRGFVVFDKMDAIRSDVLERLQNDPELDAVIFVSLFPTPEDSADVINMHKVLRTIGKRLILLTAKGGLTSHAAVVANYESIPTVVSVKGLEIDKAKGVTMSGQALDEHDIVTVDFGTGTVYAGSLPLLSKAPSASRSETRVSAKAGEEEIRSRLESLVKSSDAAISRRAKQFLSQDLVSGGRKGAANLTRAREFVAASERQDRSEMRRDVKALMDERIQGLNATYPQTTKIWEIVSQTSEVQRAFEKVDQANNTSSLVAAFKNANVVLKNILGGKRSLILLLAFHFTKSELWVYPAMSLFFMALAAFSPIELGVFSGLIALGLLIFEVVPVHTRWFYGKKQPYLASRKRVTLNGEVDIHAKAILAAFDNIMMQTVIREEHAISDAEKPTRSEVRINAKAGEEEVRAKLRELEKSSDAEVRRRAKQFLSQDLVSGGRKGAANLSRAKAFINNIRSEVRTQEERYVAADEMLRRYEQEHVLKFWDELDVAQREHLLGQIESTPLAEVARLKETLIDHPQPKNLDLSSAVPVELAAANDPDDRKAGEMLLSWGAEEDKAAFGIILMAGGSGARFREYFPFAKGLFKGLPLSDDTLFESMVKKYKAFASRYGHKKIFPLILVTSDVTHAETVAYFESQNWFGMKDRIKVVKQIVYPLIDQKTGKIFMEGKGKMALQGGGHGDAFDYILQVPDVKAWLGDFGVKTVLYSNIDNPLYPLDVNWTGAHARFVEKIKKGLVQLPRGFAIMSEGLIRKKDRLKDKLSELLKVNGIRMPVHYSKASLELRAQTSHGTPSFRMIELPLDGTLPIEFSVADKKWDGIDENGNPVTQVKVWKFERNSDDKMSDGANFPFENEDTFASIKEPPGKDESPDSSRALQTKHWKVRLEAAGYHVDDGFLIQLPWAADFMTPQELRQILEAKKFPGDLTPVWHERTVKGYLVNDDWSWGVIPQLSVRSEIRAREIGFTEGWEQVISSKMIPPGSRPVFQKERELAVRSKPGVTAFLGAPTVSPSNRFLVIENHSDELREGVVDVDLQSFPEIRNAYLKRQPQLESATVEDAFGDFWLWDPFANDGRGRGQEFYVGQNVRVEHIEGTGAQIYFKLEPGQRHSWALQSAEVLDHFHGAWKIQDQKYNEKTDETLVMRPVVPHKSFKDEVTFVVFEKISKSPYSPSQLYRATIKGDSSGRIYVVKRFSDEEKQEQEEESIGILMSALRNQREPRNFVNEILERHGVQARVYNPLLFKGIRAFQTSTGKEIPLWAYSESLAIVYPYIEGVDWGHHLQEIRSLPENEYLLHVLNIMTRASKTAAILESEGVPRWDYHPGNFILTPNEFLALLDYQKMDPRWNSAPAMLVAMFMHALKLKGIITQTEKEKPAFHFETNNRLVLAQEIIRDIILGNYQQPSDSVGDLAAKFGSSHAVLASEMGALRGRSEVRMATEKTWAATKTPRAANQHLYSRQFEAGYPMHVLKKVEELYDAYQAGQISQTTLTGGLGALLPDLFEAWPAIGLNVTGIHPLWNFIKNKPIKGTNAQGQRILFGEIVKKAMELTPIEIKVQITRRGIPTTVFFRVYKTYYQEHRSPQYYLDGYTKTTEGKEEPFFDEVYDDTGVREIHMAAFQEASERLIQALEGNSDPEHLVILDHEVFVSLPQVFLKKAKRVTLNHTVFRPGLFEAWEGHYGLFKFPEWLRSVIVHDGKISIADFTAEIYDLISGVNLVEHLPALLKNIFRVAWHRVKGFYDSKQQIRSTNGVFLPRWQARARRALIEQYKRQMAFQPPEYGLPPASNDREFFLELDKHPDLKERFKAQNEWAMTSDAARFLIWLREKRGFKGARDWLGNSLKAYQQEQGWDDATLMSRLKDMQELIQKAAFENQPEDWDALETGFSKIRDIILADPVVSNIRRQVAYKGPDKYEEIEVEEILGKILPAAAEAARQAGISSDRSGRFNRPFDSLFQFWKSYRKGENQDHGRFQREFEAVRARLKDQAAVREVRESLCRVLIGGRTFDEENAYERYLYIGFMSELLGLEDRIATLDDYTYYEAEIIFQGVQGGVMLSDKDLEASATSMMKVMANGGEVIGPFAGSNPEIWVIRDTRSGKNIEVLNEKGEPAFDYKTLREKLRSDEWQLLNGVYVDYNESEKSTQEGGEWRPSARSLLEALKTVKTLRKDPATRRERMYQSVSSAWRVDMVVGQAMGHALMIENMLQEDAEREAMFSKLKFEASDYAVPVQAPDFEWQGISGRRKHSAPGMGFFGMFRSFRDLKTWQNKVPKKQPDGSISEDYDASTRGIEAQNSIKHHAYYGDLFRYFKENILAHLSPGLDPFKEQIEDLAARATIANEKERITLNLQAMELMETLLVRMAGDWFERYMGATHPAEARVLAEQLVQGVKTNYQPWAGYIARYLDHHSNARSLGTQDHSILSYLFKMRDGQSFLVNLNVNAPVKHEEKQEFQGYKARTQVSIDAGAFSDLVGGDTEAQEVRISEPKLGKVYKIHQKSELMSEIGIGIPMPLGIEVLKWTPVRLPEIVRIIDRISDRDMTAMASLKQLIRQAGADYQRTEGEVTTNHFFEQLEDLSYYDQKNAQSLFKENMRPLLAIMGLFRPDLLGSSRIPSWGSPRFLGDLNKAVAVLKQLFGDQFFDSNGHHYYVFDASHQGSLVLARKIPITGDVFFASIILGTDKSEYESDGKVATRIQNGLERFIEPGLRYQVTNLVTGEDYGLREDLLQGWTHKVRAAPNGPRVQFLLLKKQTSNVRSELRSAKTKEPSFRVLTAAKEWQDRLNRVLTEVYQEGLIPQRTFIQISDAQPQNDPDSVNGSSEITPLPGEAKFPKQGSVTVNLYTMSRSVRSRKAFLAKVRDFADPQSKGTKVLDRLVTEASFPISRSESRVTAAAQDQVKTVDPKEWFFAQDIDRTLESLSQIVRQSEADRQPVRFVAVSNSPDQDALLAMLGFAPLQSRQEREKTLLGTLPERLGADKGALFARFGSNVTLTFSTGERMALVLTNTKPSRMLENLMANALQGVERQKGIESFTTEIQRGGIRFKEPASLEYTLMDEMTLAEGLGLEAGVVADVVVTQAEYAGLPATKPVVTTEETPKRPVISPKAAAFSNVLSGIQEAWNERQSHWGVQRVEQEQDALAGWDDVIKAHNLEWSGLLKRIEDNTAVQAQILFQTISGKNVSMDEIEKAKQDVRKDLASIMLNETPYGQILKSETAVEVLLRLPVDLNDSGALKKHLEKIFRELIRLQNLIRDRTIAMIRASERGEHPEMLYFLIKDIVQLHFLQKASAVIISSQDKELSDFSLKLLGKQPRITMVKKLHPQPASSASTDREKILASVSGLTELLRDRKAFYDAKSPTLAETVGRIYGDLVGELRGLTSVTEDPAFSYQLRRALDMLVTVWSSDERGYWMTGTQGQSPIAPTLQAQYGRIMEQIMVPLFMDSSAEVHTYVFGEKPSDTFKLAALRSELRKGSGSHLPEVVSLPVPAFMDDQVLKVEDKTAMIPAYDLFIRENIQRGGSGEKGMRSVTEKIMDGIIPLLAHTLNAVELLMPEAAKIPTVQKIHAAAARRVLGLAPNIGYAFILGSDLALRKGMIEMAKSILKDSTFAILVKNDAALVAQAEALIKQEGLQDRVFVITDVKLARSRISKPGAALRGFISSDELMLAEELKAELKDDLIVMDKGMRERFLNAAGQLFQSLADKIAAQFSLARSA